MSLSSASERRSHSGSSSDTSVYFEAEVRPPNVDNATASSGIIERDLQTERTSGESSAVGTSSHSSQLTASARLTQNQALAAILAKLFDHRTPFRKKSFLIVSDPSIAKHILRDNSKGSLAEILDFVMGKGLIPAERYGPRIASEGILFLSCSLHSMFPVVEKPV